MFTAVHLLAASCLPGGNVPLHWGEENGRDGFLPLPSLPARAGGAPPSQGPCRQTGCGLPLK